MTAAEPRLSPSMDTLARLLHAVDADNATLRAQLPELRAAAQRARDLSDAYADSWLDERDELVAQFGAEVTPRVLSEDAIFDALTEHERLMKALLHLVASSVFMDDTDPDEG